MILINQLSATERSHSPAGASINITYFDNSTNFEHVSFFSFSFDGDEIPSLCFFAFAFYGDYYFFDGEVMTKKTALVKRGKLLILTNRRPHLSQSLTLFFAILDSFASILVSAFSDLLYHSVAAFFCKCPKRLCTV